MPASVGIGVGAWVVRDGKLLMLQRTGAHGAELWSVPGGWVDVRDGRAESPGEAAVREVLEETGVTVAASVGPNSRYALSWPTVDGVHSYCAWVPCTFVSGDARVMEPEKCRAVEWVALGDVPSRQLFPHLRDCLDRYR